MANYFVNGNIFAPPKNEKNLQVLDSVTGVLEFYETKPGNNASGFWYIIHLKVDDGTIKIFCNPERISPETLQIIDTVQGKRIKLTCKNSILSIHATEVNSEFEIRSTLLKGVASGNIKREDLPALLAFANGDDNLFDEWLLFKKQLDNEGLENIRNQVYEEMSQLQIKIDLERTKLNELKDVYSTVAREKESLLKELNSALLLLQGEEHLQGTYAHYLNGDSEEMVSIGSGYHNLVSAFNKAGTRKGIFVICNNQIHQIHHVFLEEKGRAFLLGTQREYLKANPEKVKVIIDKLEDIKNNPIQCL